MSSYSIQKDSSLWYRTVAFFSNDVILSRAPETVKLPTAPFKKRSVAEDIHYHASRLRHPAQQSPKLVVLYVNERRLTCIKKDTVSCQIGAEGGVLSLSLYGVSLVIPPGAIGSATQWLDVTLSLFVSDTPIIIGGKTAYVNLTELLPHKAQFLKPVILRHELMHHRKLDADCIETQFHLFYGEGINPLETYDFMGSLESACRQSAYKNMQLSLWNDNFQLSAFSFCLVCSVIRSGTFGITISFFVCSKGAGERKRWEVRVAISCSCKDNVENIIQDQEKIGYRFANKKVLCCYSQNLDGQRLEIAIDGKDDFTSKFTQRPEIQFCGRELFHVVQGDTYNHLTEACTIIGSKCSDDDLSCRTKPVLFSCKYTSGKRKSRRKQLRPDSQIAVWLNSESSCDHRLVTLSANDSTVLHFYQIIETRRASLCHRRAIVNRLLLVSLGHAIYKRFLLYTSDFGRKRDFYWFVRML